MALSRVFALHRTKPIAAFGRPELREVQNEMIRDGYARSTINGNVRRIQCVWTRLAQEDLIPDSLASAVRMLPRLKRGRSEAVEQPRVRPAERRHVLAAIAAAGEPWRSMLLLQLLTGMRPGEVSILGPRHLSEREGGDGLQIDFGEDHKTAWRDQPRVVPLGAGATLLLIPWLFDALRTRRDRLFVSPTGRRLPNTALAKALNAITARAGLPRFSPNQIRHLVGGEVRRQFGLEAAQAVLGHANASTTERYYAPVENAAAAAVADRIG